MAVPGQDQRDWDFAEVYGLPIVRTVEPPAGFAGKAYLGDGPAIHSGFLDALTLEPAKERMIAWLEEHGKGRARVEYRLRDWLFSRQRYWGEPFPIVHVLDENGAPTGELVPLPDSALPVELPPVDEYKPTPDGRPPLARADDDWLLVTLPDGRRALRETNTMPQWAGSCWYYLRYLDPHNDQAPFSPEAERYWMPVDLYVGGVEHAVLHLLYSRFWHKVLWDCGLVSTKEPFQRLFNQGMILAYSYQDARGRYYLPDDVEWRGEKAFNAEGEELLARVEKMSKSKLNIANPDDIVSGWGADSLRLYELFMGPLEQQKPWQTKGVEGVYRFLQRVWRLVVDEDTGELNPRIVDAAPPSEPELERLLHKTIKKVGECIDALQMNTAISQMMIWTNAATSSATLPRASLERFLEVLAPWAPHLAEEVWSRLGHAELICKRPWPAYDAALTVDDTITLVIQVNGKKRAELQVARDTDRATLERLALEHENTVRHLEGREPKKVVVVPGRLVNVVV
jgi:leucyl-tRNA synthetase